MSIVYVHNDNYDSKLSNTKYKSKWTKIKKFKRDFYLTMRSSLEALDFTENDFATFETAANIINSYIQELHSFCKANKINSKSKLESSYLEELSCYLFWKNPAIQTGMFSIFNKNVFAGLKINNDYSIEIVPKDVDFCIGKKEEIKIGDDNKGTIIIPAISVEVKTYIDSTMLGEAMYTARKIKGATPGSKTYLLAGLKDMKNIHIIEARDDSSLDELITLGPKPQGYKRGYSPIVTTKGLYDYWLEITCALEDLKTVHNPPIEGRLLTYTKKIYQYLNSTTSVSDNTDDNYYEEED